MDLLNLDHTVLAVTVPFLMYWVASGYYELMSNINTPYVNQHKLFQKDAERYNRVSRRKVCLTVLAQHLTQMVLGLLLLEKAPDTSHRSYLDTAVRFGAAMLVMDAWQYSFHRVFHEVPWLYKHVHSWHHTISIPYSYGALYQHPVEMLIMDTLSGLVAVEAAGCSPLTAMFFWSFSYIKTVSDHSNFSFPVNPFNIDGCNNADYHAVHHAPKGLRLNYCQPYFTIWDQVFGSFHDPKLGPSLTKVD